MKKAEEKAKKEKEERLKKEAEAAAAAKAEHTEEMKRLRRALEKLLREYRTGILLSHAAAHELQIFVITRRKFENFHEFCGSPGPSSCSPTQRRIGLFRVSFRPSNFEKRPAHKRLCTEVAKYRS